MLSDCNIELLLQLIRKAFGRIETVEADEASVDLDTVAVLLRRQGIVPLVYPYVQERASGGEPFWESLRDRLKAKNDKALWMAIRQESAIEDVLSAFETNALDCIPLKGWVVRRYYPQSFGRTMSDFDVLFKDYDYQKLKELMESLGFRSEKNEESTWKHDGFIRSNVEVETHKRLTEHGSMAQWEAEVWERARPEEGFEHVFLMSDEDYYIYHLLHLAHHFEDGRLVLRPVIDIKAFLSAKAEIDRAYVDRRLDRAGLLLFAERMETLADAVFGDKPIDDNSELLLRFALGTRREEAESRYRAGRAVRYSPKSLSRGRFRSILYAVFLPYERMAAQFPALRKHPILLPFYWAKRIFFHLRHGMKRHIKRFDYHDVSQEQYDEVREAFAAAGILDN